MTTLNRLFDNHGYYAGVNSIDTSGYVAVIPAFQSVYLADGRTFDNHGYNRIDFVHTKVVGIPNAALQVGEVVTQATSGVKGIYGGCYDIKITGTMSGNFTVGEVVTQATTGAKGYVAYSDSANSNLFVFPITYTLETPLEFSTGAYTITGATSGKTLTNPSAVSSWYDYNAPPTASTGAVGRFHFIYRTDTTEFDISHAITGANTGSVITLAGTGYTAVQEVQTCTPNAQATSGTFTITYKEQTTAAIAYNASTATIKTALETLSTVDVDDITVGGTIFSAGTGGLTLTFLAALGDVPIVSITSSMVGATTVTVAETTKGVAIVTAPPHYLPWIPVAGILPDGGSNIGCLCFNRIFLNSMLNPHHWHCARSFYPLDWDSSQTDVAAATYGQAQEKAGVVGDPIVSMSPYKDFYLVWGCANSIYILTSDPLMGGVQRNLTQSTGMFSPTAYCWDDKNNFYFLGTDGIYALSAEAIINASPPANLTKQHNPKLISSLGLNRRTDRVAMAYDKKKYGIRVDITQQDGTWGISFWLDLRTGGLFPLKYPTGQYATSLFYFDSYKSTERDLLIGCYDGYIRKENEANKSDDGSVAIEAHVTLGPIVAGGEPRETIGINETSLVLGEESDAVTVDYYRGTSADAVVNDVLNEETPMHTKSLTGDGLQSSIIDRISGRAVAVKIKNETVDQTFSLEEINFTLQNEGRKK
jgi:hypothetical protein